MPVRKAVATRLAQDLTKTSHWRYTDPDGCSYEEFEHAKEVGDSIFWRVVTKTDWSRVLIEAMGIHVGRDTHGYGPSQEVCGDCILQALQMDDRMSRVAGDPPKIEDWTADVAQCISYRRDA